MSEKVLLITGASGFLGQHLVKLTHQRNELNITKLVLFDRVSFTKKLEYAETIQQEIIAGDITKMDDVRRALKGVEYVIHSCGFVDVSIFPDLDTMERVNVKGTRNIISACVEEGVRSLVYTGSATAMVTNTDIDMGDESQPYPDENSVVTSYAASKQRAEKLVLAANATSCPSGAGLLMTAVVRPVGMYGELDRVLVAEVIRRGVLGWVCVGPTGCSNQQIAYVGNTAWAHLCALKALQENPRQAGGEAYYITDNTPPGPYPSLYEGIISGADQKFRCFKVPHHVILLALYVAQIFMLILRPLVKLNLPTDPRSIRMIQLKLLFSRKKVETRCNYKPIFTYEESLGNSVAYYKNVISS